jgi:hypothetical protein
MAQTYGMHLPMRIRMELDILSQAKRLPGIRSSNIGAETILGRDETIDFEDFLGSTCTSQFCPAHSHPPRSRTSMPQHLEARRITPPTSLHATPDQTCMPIAAAPDMSETTIDMRAVLEKKHGVARRSTLHARIGGPAPSMREELPRANVAMAKELSMF